MVERQHELNSEKTKLEVEKRRAQVRDMRMREQEAKFYKTVAKYKDIMRENNSKVEKLVLKGNKMKERLQIFEKQEKDFLKKIHHLN